MVLVVVDAAVVVVAVVVVVVLVVVVVVMVAMSWYQCRDVLSVRGWLIWKSVVIVVWLSVNNLSSNLSSMWIVVKLLVMELLVKVIACVPKVVGVDGPLWVHVASLVVLA